jgi:hypothetical protein
MFMRSLNVLKFFYVPYGLPLILLGIANHYRHFCFWSSPIVGKVGVKIIFGLCGEWALGPNGLRDKPVTSDTLRVS